MNIDVRKYQLKQLDLIKEIDKVCTVLGITYYLIGGTLLGAIRHGGFIPWDTDMDIALKREDYEKLRKYWENNENSKFFFQHYENEKNHLSPHAILKLKGTRIFFKNRNSEKYVPKYSGLFLDIFPLDEPPCDKKSQEKQAKAIRLIEQIIELKAAFTYNNTGKMKLFAKKLIQFLLFPFSLHFLQKKLDGVMQKYNGSGSGYLVSMASHYSYWKQLMPADIYGEPVKVSYEGLLLSAPAEIDEYLKRIYGDYMKLPPENKRSNEMENILNVDYGEYYEEK